MTKLCPRGKAAAKRKFKVYPSAYANAYASKICAGKAKDPSGVKRKDWGPKKANTGTFVSGKINIRKKLKNLEPPVKTPMMRVKNKAGDSARKKYQENLKQYEKLKSIKESQKQTRPMPRKKFKKGGGADTGRRGELKSQLGVAINKIKRNRPERLTSKDLKKIKQKFQSEKDLPRSMRIDTTTSAYGDAGRGRPVPKYETGGLPRTIPGQNPRGVKPRDPRYVPERYKKPTSGTKKGMRKKLPGIKRDKPAKGFNVGGLADYYKDLM